MNHLRTLAVGVGICVAIAMIACGNGNPNTGGPSGGGGTCNGTAKASGLGTPAMTINATDDLVFAPASSTAQTGQVIEFKNTGSVAHNVTFQDGNDGCLTDDALDPGATWDVMLSSPGTYNFLCTIHAPNMKGALTITGSASTPGASSSASASASPGTSPSPSPTATPAA
ncbi:MAG: plastocyanin/azurin family copper-binding protein [Candidatus Dormiibacterota bacterium]